MTTEHAERPSTADGRATGESTATMSQSTDSATPSMDAPFPPNRDDVDETIWYRQVSNPEQSLVLEPSTTTASLPQAELSFTLRNGTDRPFESNFYDWSLYRWERGRWHYIMPLAGVDPLNTLSPGFSHRWMLTVDNERFPQSWTRPLGDEDLTLHGLGGGTYAFSIDGWWPDQEETPADEHKTAYAARFTLDGEPLSLEPSRDVTDVERGCRTVVVSLIDERATETDDEPGATLVLTRDDSVTDPYHLVTEQLYRQGPLRDAIAYAEPHLTEVRVETSATIPQRGMPEDPSPVAYEGQTYRVDTIANPE